MTTSFDRAFASVHDRSVQLVRAIAEKDLFRRPRELDRPIARFSCGEYVLRSAASVEQASGGITTRLWDDPFEWTLPEKLSTTTLVIEYLDEVEATRTRAFGFFRSDDDLMKQIPAPERLRSIFELLLDTLRRTEHYQGRAFALFQLLTDEAPPRV